MTQYRCSDRRIFIHYIRSRYENIHRTDKRSSNRIIASLIIDVSPDKCNITKDCAIDYVNNFHHIANNDNIELVLRMAKLSDKLNMMNIDDYYESYISFVMSRFNGIMDSYDVYNSISVDDVRDMVKDITEDKLIIQYCS